jgi:hypothetical protein
MAHHANTPQAVLDAPQQTVAILVEHKGATRQERRHGFANPAGLKPLAFAAYCRQMLSVSNTPHVARATRRGKKVRRNRAA